MDTKLGVICLLFLAISITITFHRHYKNVPLEVDRMEILVKETIKLINKRFSKDDNETSQLLHLITNDLHLHLKDALNAFHKSVDVLQNSTLKSTFTSFAHKVHVPIYGLLNVDAKDSVKVRSQLTSSLESLNKLFPMAKEIIKQAVEEQQELAVSLATYAYDLALFAYANGFIETKFCRESNERIEQDMEQFLTNVYSLLKETTTATAINLKEFDALIQIICKRCSETIEKLNRLAYIYQAKPTHSRITSAVSQNLQRIIDTYNTTLVNTTSVELEVNLKRPVAGLITEVKKLGAIVDHSHTDEEDIYRNILLETFSLVVSLNIKLEVLKHTQNS